MTEIWKIFLTNLSNCDHLCMPLNASAIFIDHLDRHTGVTADQLSKHE